MPKDRIVLAGFNGDNRENLSDKLKINGGLAVVETNAHKIFEAYATSQDIRAVVVDPELFRIGGHDLVPVLAAARKKGKPILICSYASEELLVKRGYQPNIHYSGYLQRPASDDAILEAVRDVLRRS